MTFCTACGRQRAGANPFCTACGTEFRDLAQPEPPVTADAAPVPGGASMKPDAFRERMPTYAEPPTAEPLYAEPTYPGPVYAEPSPGRPGDQYPGPIGRPPGRRSQIIVMAAVAIVVLGAAGGAYALLTNHGHEKAAGRRPTTASIAASQATSASAAQPTSAPASSTASSGTTVAVAPGAASNPAAPQVTALVNSYFTAIDQHDYSAYASLFDQQMQQQNPESSFDSGYATTTDSAETLTGNSDTDSGRGLGDVHEPAESRGQPGQQFLRPVVDHPFPGPERRRVPDRAASVELPRFLPGLLVRA
jgi:hypothetical protein